MQIGSSLVSRESNCMSGWSARLHIRGSLQPGLLPKRPLRLQVVAATSGESKGGDHEHRTGRGKEAQALYQSLQAGLATGSEYGEGFVQFRMGGQAHHLDVDSLNQQLQTGGALRIRHAMKPDEAHGMIFNWDGVVANTRALQQRAWQRVADEEGLPPIPAGRQIYDIRPERAITEVLQWTREWAYAQQLGFRVAQAYSEEFRQLNEAMPGLPQWLSALGKAGVPCAVVTSMDRMSLGAALQRMGLGSAFGARVTCEDGMETVSQMFLSAAIKLGRPPNQCVVFDSSPRGIVAAHNCTMKAVAVQGHHRGYELKQADLTCSSMAELSVINVRRLFANRGYELMDLRKAPTGRGAGTRRRTAAAVLEPRE